MGHQFARAALAAAIAFSVGACGSGDGDSDPPPVLDNAREQVSPADDGTDSDPAPTTTESAVAADAPAELPPPDPSTFEGSNRIVNLWVGADGETTTVDVWGRRTFTNGPILLAEGVPFGQASEYFSAPSGYSLVVVGAGAGPDGEERASMFNASVGEQITTVFGTADDRGGVDAQNLFERGNDDDAPAPPPEGAGVVILASANTEAFSDSLTDALGGSAYFVGDGSAACRSQRTDDDGLPSDVVGGSRPVELELQPGPATLSLHPSPSPAECDQSSALELTVDVMDGGTTLVLVYSQDGSRIEALVLPVAEATG